MHLTFSTERFSSESTLEFVGAFSVRNFYTKFFIYRATNKQHDTQSAGEFKR